jgi:hypothetical protein
MDSEAPDVPLFADLNDADPAVVEAVSEARRTFPQFLNAASKMRFSPAIYLVKVPFGRSGFAAGWEERSGAATVTRRMPTLGTFWSDTLGLPATVAGFSWLLRMKGYHDVRTQKPHVPGYATRRAG